MRSGRAEEQSGAGHEIADGARGQDLAGAGDAGDGAGDLDGCAGGARLDQAAFAGVNADPQCDRQLLREINQALSKIMDGRYGICEGTGKVISKARLEVQPWAKYSIEHARKLENRGVR